MFATWVIGSLSSQLVSSRTVAASVYVPDAGDQTVKNVAELHHMQLQASVAPYTFIVFIHILHASLRACCMQKLGSMHIIFM